KIGRVLRTIQNWIDDSTSPDERILMADWEWVFNPQTHGTSNDENLITEYAYDQAGRPVSIVDAEGHESLTAYFKNGQVAQVSDGEEVVTLYRYDKLQRRTRVVQAFVSNGEDPAEWIWDDGDTRWER